MRMENSHPVYGRPDDSPAPQFFRDAGEAETALHGIRFKTVRPSYLEIVDIRTIENAWLRQQVERWLIPARER